MATFIYYAVVPFFAGTFFGIEAAGVLMIFNGFLALAIGIDEIKAGQQ